MLPQHFVLVTSLHLGCTKPLFHHLPSTTKYLHKICDLSSFLHLPVVAIVWRQLQDDLPPGSDFLLQAMCEKKWHTRGPVQVTWCGSQEWRGPGCSITRRDSSWGIEALNSIDFKHGIFISCSSPDPSLRTWHFLGIPLKNSDPSTEESIIYKLISVTHW